MKVYVQCGEVYLFWSSKGVSFEGQIGIALVFGLQRGLGLAPMPLSSLHAVGPLFGDFAAGFSARARLNAMFLSTA